MKTFCITGHDQAALYSVATLLEKAGSVPASNSDRDATLSISEWHKMVAERNVSEPSRLSWTTGRFLEKIIIDIFLANRSKPLWHWIDASGAMLLDYWEEFDPNINFLLVYESPVDTLIKIYDAGTRSTHDYDQALKGWKDKTERLIDFMDRNPEKTLMISGSTLKSNPDFCTTEISKKWQLNLDSIVEATVCSRSTTPSIDMLLSCYVNEHLDIKTVENKAQSFFIAAPTSNESNRRERIIEEINRYTTGPLKENGLSLAEFMSKNNKDGEHIYLESSLHACQERLEAVYEKKRVAHSTMLQYQSRLSKALQRHKCPWEFNTLKSQVVLSNDTGHYIEWQVTDTYIDNTHYDVISFMTRSLDSMTGFVIKPTHTLFLMMSTDNAIDSEDILLFPSPGSYQQENNRRISALSTSAWAFITALTSIMVNQLNNSSIGILPTGGNRKIVSTGLNNLSKTLQSWPSVLRYDKTSHIGNFNDNEKKLQIVMENVELGEIRLPSLSYCINADLLAPIKRFSLTFAESSQSWFRNWFINTPEKSNNGLILEFIAPDILPPETWGSLSNDDHVLVAAVVADMEQQLLYSTTTHNSNNSTDWKLICSELKSIFINAHKTSYQTHSR